jgi:hypothetical protein
MKSLYGLTLICLIFSACDSANSSHPSVQYEEKKKSLRESETDNPLKFLKVKGSLRSNIIGQTVVEGEIINNATLVSYKNMKLQIIFKDADGSVVEKDSKVIDDVVKPNSTDNFKVKLSHVKGASTVLVDITGAEVD